jgi:glycerol-3-phosphate dehydrogenase
VGDQVLTIALPGDTQRHLRLVKGSHLIMPRLWAGPHCYIFQNRDGASSSPFPMKARSL